MSKDACVVCGEQLELASTVHINPTHGRCGTLRARIAKLEAENAHLFAIITPDNVTAWQQGMRARIAELEALLRETSDRVAVHLRERIDAALTPESLSKPETYTGMYAISSAVALQAAFQMGWCARAYRDRKGGRKWWLRERLAAMWPSFE